MELERKDDIAATARALVAPGKGILAADESMGTIEKRLKGAGIEPSDAHRHAYREMLFNAPGLGEYISGVILFDETLRQKAADGAPLVETLRRAGIIPGIKVDQGAQPLAHFPGEKITEGLDGLRDRLKKYKELGARFAKWRAVITLGEGLPSPTCIRANAQALARYAALCQEAGLVPIVEPEVLMDGPHDLMRHLVATESTLHRVFSTLREHRVRLDAMLLKVNMVLSGTTCATQAGAAEVAVATLGCLRRAVPAAVPGIVFLSGGQSDAQATVHLDALNRAGPQPWELSFSYGRALQAAALKAWGGQSAKVAAGQQALLLRARCNAAARSGQYTPELERR